MKRTLSALLGLFLFLAGARCKFTGFEANVNRMITAYKIFIEDVERGFSRLLFYFDNLDNYATNEQLFTVSFTDSLNETIESLEDSKPAIYDSLQTLLSEVYYIFNRRAIYHTTLREGYDEVVQFIATMDTEDLDKTLSDLFREFLVKKNLFFYDVTNLKDYIENSAINAVNAFDMLETFAHDTMRVGESYQKLTLRQVQGFYFIGGFLSQLREYYQNHNQMLESINKAFLSLEDTIEELDEFLESIKFYYYRRYVDGYTEEQINNFPQELFSEKVEDDVSPEVDSKAVEDERDPIDVCDQVLLSNFGVKGLNIAAEVDEFEKLEECPAIRNTCCAQKELTQLYQKYFDTHFDVLARKLGLLAGILGKILNNYETLRDLAYRFLKNPASSAQCREAGRKVVFTPISQDFVRKFELYMGNGHEFLSRSRSAAFCMICDYDFHKTLQEEGRVKLSPEFCSSMMENLFDYTSVYNLQLLDYFNQLVDLVQCDPETGGLQKDVLLEFKADEALSAVLERCGGHRDYCVEFCQQFRFLSVESALDADIPLLRQFYHLLDVRLKKLGRPLAGFINSEFFSAAGMSYSLERVPLRSKSLDFLTQEYVTGADAATAHNPFLDGTKLIKLIRLQESED